MSPAVAARIEQAVRRLDYRRNAVARSLRQLRTRSYGLALPDVSNNFFAAILKGVQSALNGEDYAVLVADAANDPQLERTNVERLLERRVDGLLLVPVGAGEALPRGLARGAVVIDRLPAGWRGPAVASDHEHGGQLIAVHLTGPGHERIALVAGRGEITSARDRSRGLLDEARHEGVEIPERWQ